MVLVSFLGLSFFMTGITGEKQQRITEQIVSAISPQAWIDGKLIGLTAASFASTSSILVTGLATYGIAWLAGYGFVLPGSMTRWDLLPVLIVLFVGGAIFWNCFYAAISSIINDPNTSARSGLWPWFTAHAAPSELGIIRAILPGFVRSANFTPGIENAIAFAIESQGCTVENLG
ncbi:MAG: hypothetical protein NTY15_09855 [Planctomycetota bacterium]|nr:hypothetical protein [Planctomycetota bacterium]